MLDNYYADEYSIIHQKKIEQFSKDYATQYNNYGELSNYMSYLRLGYIFGVLGYAPKSILDIGYGNGSFLSVCRNIIPECYGYDISDYNVPEGCNRVCDLSGNYDAITMFDSFEHFEDISFVHNLNCKFLIISIPNCKNGFSDEWFLNWKHRRPNEHLHHFCLQSIISYLDKTYYCENACFVEDTIRKNKEANNILTATFSKRLR